MCTQGQPGRDPRHQGSHSDTRDLRQHTPGAVEHPPQGELVQGQDENPPQPARSPHKGADSRLAIQGQLNPEANGHQGPKTATEWHWTQENTLDFHHPQCPAITESHGAQVETGTCSHDALAAPRCLLLEECFVLVTMLQQWHLPEMVSHFLTYFNPTFQAAKPHSFMPSYLSCYGVKLQLHRPYQHSVIPTVRLAKRGRLCCKIISTLCWCLCLSDKWA